MTVPLLGHYDCVVIRVVMTVYLYLGHGHDCVNINYLYVLYCETYATFTPHILINANTHILSTLRWLRNSRTEQSENWNGFSLVVSVSSLGADAMTYWSLLLQ